jgi:hypothetical protein
VTLIARVNNPDHPAFEALLAEGSDRMDTLVLSLRQRLRQAIEAAQLQQQAAPAPGTDPAGRQSDLRFDPSGK